MENKGEQTKMELDALTEKKRVAYSQKIKEIEDRLTDIEKSLLQLFHEVSVLYKAHK